MIVVVAEAATAVVEVIVVVLLLFEPGYGCRSALKDGKHDLTGFKVCTFNLCIRYHGHRRCLLG